MPVLRRTAMAGLLGALAACAPAKRGSESGGADAPRLPTVLVVEIRRPMNYSLFLDRGGQRLRLGEVVGPGTARFTVPPDLINSARPLRVIADPAGEFQALTAEAVVRHGDLARFIIDESEARMIVEPGFQDD